MATIRENNAPNPVRSDHTHSDPTTMLGGNEKAPMLVRVTAHRERIEQAVSDLESEKFELLSRLEHLHRQFYALEQGFNVQIADIEQTLKLYENGLNSVPMQKH
jgi:hypothetical protein